jgi:hypothetical protein
MSFPAKCVREISASSRTPGWRQSLLLWAVIFLICFGLGYPTLNRYDPQKLLPDSASYSRIVTSGPRAVEGYFRFRVLEPYLVRPLYSLAKSHVGSWDPLMFGFLVVNSLFVATTGYLLSTLGYVQFKNYPVALLAVALYLLNFNVANQQLAGLVDAGEAFFLMAVVAGMFFQRWWLLPILGTMGALTKESFVPFSLTMAGVWWLCPERHRAGRFNTGAWVASMALVEFATVTILQSSISGSLIWPWTFAEAMNSHANHTLKFLTSLVDRNSWYILIWLLPLGLVGIRRFPRAWVWACAAASLVALLLNAYHTLSAEQGGVGRYLFNIAGPLLSLSAAGFLCMAEPPPDNVEPAN